MDFQKASEALVIEDISPHVSLVKSLLGQLVVVVDIPVSLKQFVVVADIPPPFQPIS